MQKPPRSPSAISVSVVRVIRTPTPRCRSSSRSSMADLERDVLLPHAAGKVRPGIAGVHASVPRIDGDHVARPEPVGRGARRCRAAVAGPGFLETSSRRAARAIVAVSLTQVVRQDLGDELERQKQRVARHPDRRRERLELAAEDVERRADQEAERLPGDGHLGPALAQLERAAERREQLGGGQDRRAGRIGADRDLRLAARGGDRDLPRRGRRERRASARAATMLTREPPARGRGTPRARPPARRPGASGPRACRAASSRAPARGPPWPGRS